MRLNEVKPGTPVKIEIIQGKKKLEFDSQAVNVVNNNLLIDCIRYQNAVLNLNAKNVQINLIAFMLPLPIQFTNVKIELFHQGEKMYHCVAAPYQGRKMNRRNSFRVFIGESGIIQVGENKRTQDILVKDISETGFAIMSERDLNADNANVRLEYKDKGTTIILQGKVVRKEKVLKNNFLYGCRLEKNPKGLGSYLAKKQQIRRK